MDAARWARVKSLYTDASARSPTDRAAFLVEACRDDADLCREVQALLDQPVDTGDLRNLVQGAAPPPQEHRDLTGTKLGVFEIRGFIGRGGMGEVYRAHDTKLGRDVAIKVLPAAFTADERRLASFEREARVVASLNHPHIAAIHGVEESDGTRGLVLELVEGETLAEKLERARTQGRSSLPLAEILGYARQIADALEAAHEKGITHRDLKPANVKNAPFSWTRPFQKVTLAGGPALKLAEYDMFHRGDWSDDGWLYWTNRYPGGIVRIRESGGEIEAVTKLDVASGERSHRFASLLPGADALIYTVGFEGIDNYDDARIDLWDLKTGAKKTIVQGGTSAVYSPSGHIVYARAGKLMAVPFDLRRRDVTGTAFEVQDGVMMSRNTGAAHYTLSKRGDLAYVPGPAEGGRRTLVWVDRSGKADPLPLPSRSYLYPRISPDGRTLAVEIEGPNHDFYFYDFARTVLSKVTTDGLSHDPVWSPDGARLAFRSWQAGGMTLWSMRSDRSGVPERLDPAGTRQSPVSFSPDGQFLAFDQKDPETRDDAWVLPLQGNKTPQAVAHTRFGEGSMKFSPDGRWVAYSSDESDRPEIYVQAFPGPGPKVQVSNAGGTDPVWRRSGGELFYRNDNKMMVVSVVTSPVFKASAPRQLWEGMYSHGTGASCGMPGVSSSNYDVTADGQRFLMVRDEDESAFSTKIVVVLNWMEQVKAIERTRAQAAAAAR